MASLLSAQAPVNLRGATDLALLHQLQCQVCPLNVTVGGKMAPTGAEQPLVYILGEGPGANEIEEREQFVGDSGQILRAHIPRQFRSRVRFNNVVRSRPPGNATPDYTMVECCRPSVRADIERSKPKAIFGFGNVPLEWIAPGFSRVTLWRGRRMPVRVGSHTCWYYPMLHPAYLLRMRRRDSISEEERMFRFDMKRAFAEVEQLPKAVVHTVADVRVGVEIIVEKGAAGLRRLREALAWAKTQPTIGVDYETNCLRPYARGAKLLTGAVGTAERAVAFPFEHPESQWSKSDLEEVKALWVDFLLHAKGRKAVHNLAFEMEWSSFFFGNEVLRAGRWEDTATQASIIDERKGERKPGCFSLEFLVQQYFGVNIKKIAGVDRANLAKTPLELVLHYNGPDAKYHAQLCDLQRVVIAEEGLQEPYELGLRSVPTVVLTQQKGLPIAQAEVRRLSAKYTTKFDDVAAAIAKLSIVAEFKKMKREEFNPLSNPHVLYVFKDLLHRDEVAVVDKYSKKQKYSVDESVLEQIDHPLAKLVLDCRHYNKRKSTYVDPLDERLPDNLLFADGLVHGQFNTFFAETGRTSCVREGTLVSISGGTKPIEDMKIGDLVYAFDAEKKLVLRKVKNVWYQGRKPVLRLHWISQGSGEEGHLDVTADHRIRLTSGEYVAAGTLKGGDLRFLRGRKRWLRGEHVMALHRGKRSGRNELYATFATSCRESRFVFEAVNGWSPEHVHHKDGDKQNDVPSNLEGMTHSAHTSLHAREAMSVPGEAVRRLKLISPEARAVARRKIIVSSKAKAAARFTREQVVEALEEGEGIKGACVLLDCDYSTIRARIEQWGITDWDGRSKNHDRPWQRKARGPYKGHTTYARKSKYNHMIQRVTWLRGLYNVYDIEVEGVHNFIANEICVHNCSDPNLQNYPARDGEAKEVRKPFVAAPGCVILSFDMGQIEARVIAMATKDRRFVKALWERYDIHMEWAERLAYAYPARVGGKKMLQDKGAMKKFRTDVKNQWSFPLFFGARLESAAGYLHMPVDVVRPLYEEFWQQFSGVKAWQNRLLDFYHEHGYVECLTGRRRRGPLSVNQVLNSPVQGTAAALVLDAMSRLSETGDMELQPEINIHDDLTWVRVPEKRVDDIAERILQIMLKPVFPWINVPLTVEGKVGPNWLEMEEFGAFSSDEWGFHDK